MATDKYKNQEDLNITTNKGIRIEEEDLKIFSRENTDALFGDSEKDNIEFALYDTNNNLLGFAIKPSEQIVLDAGSAQIAGQPKQILLDPQYDINELGFETGTFQVSYQFFRNKLGSYLTSERAYIQKISPSREEIRILPVIYGNDNDMDRTVDFEQFKLNILDDIVLSKMLNDTLKFDLATIEYQMDALFIQQFQNEFNFDDNTLKQFYEDVINELRTQLQALIVDEIYPTKEKIKNLFVTILSNILNKKIPNTVSSEENPVLNTATDTFVTLEDLNKRIAQEALDIQVIKETKKKVFIPELQPKGAIKGGLKPIVINEPVIIVDRYDGPTTIEPIDKKPIAEKPVEEDPISKEPIIEEETPIKIVKKRTASSGGGSEISEIVE